VLVIAGATLTTGLTSSPARADHMQMTVSSAQDGAAIEEVLAHYRISVSRSDKAPFLSTILEEKIL
jgi:hypothetical protein